MNHKAARSYTVMPFRHLLRDERHRRGWSQERVADEIGILQQTYANWELGALPRPTSDLDEDWEVYQATLQQLCDYLDLPVGVLLLSIHAPTARPEARRWLTELEIQQARFSVLTHKLAKLVVAGT